MRLSVVAACLSLCLVGFAAANDAYASIRKDTNIPAEGLGPALNALARDRNFQIVYVTEEIANVRTAGATGSFTTEEALKRLLIGTGLSYRYLDDKTVTILPVGSVSTPNERAAPTARENQGGAVSDASEGKKSSQDFRVAQVSPGQAQVAPAIATSQPNTHPSGEALEEIVVTAQKRSERLLDVPQSVSVLTASDLGKLGATQLADFAATVPGLSFTTAGAGFTQVTLRGVSVGNDVSPTVGIYVDEVPYGSSTAFALTAQLAFDPALFDLDHIEILRGPQGTLYGASSMGGVLKYVTQQPSTTTFGGDAQAGVSSTHDGGVNYNTAAAVNLPIIPDKAAVRISGFESHDGGYIDNVALGEENVNRSNTYGGRVDLLLTPTDDLSIRLNGFLQDISRDGEATADYTYTGGQPYGALGQHRLFDEPFAQHFRLGSATVTYNFGPAILTSVSSYQTSRTEFFADISLFYVPAFNALGPFSAVGYPVSVGTDKFTQEVRLASSPGARPLEWVIGAFYTHEVSSNDQQFTFLNLAGQPVPNNIYTVSRPSTYEEAAGFGDLTWHLTDKLDLTGGLRFAGNRQSFEQIGSGLLIGSEPEAHSSENIVTYLGDLRYHFSNQVTGYLRYATGYRPGGPNVVTVAGGPPTFESDTLRSYEIGVKAETADRRFGFDAAAYDIEWSNIQLLAVRNGFGVYLNAPGGARIDGGEFAFTARPIDQFVLTGSLAFQHAYLKEADADLGASAGERLPNVPRFTTAIDADYVFFHGGLEPHAGAAVRYVADRYASFDGINAPPQYYLPGYATADVRGSVTISSVDLQLYVHNIADRRGQLGVLLPQFGPRVAIEQPRTVGLQASIKF